MRARTHPYTVEKRVKTRHGSGPGCPFGIVSSLTVGVLSTYPRLPSGQIRPGPIGPENTKVLCVYWAARCQPKEAAGGTQKSNAVKHRLQRRAAFTRLFIAPHMAVACGSRYENATRTSVVTAGDRINRDRAARLRRASLIRVLWEPWPPPSRLFISGIATLCQFVRRP